MKVTVVASLRLGILDDVLCDFHVTERVEQVNLLPQMLLVRDGPWSISSEVVWNLGEVRVGVLDNGFLVGGGVCSRGWYVQDCSS